MLWSPFFGQVSGQTVQSKFMQEEDESQFIIINLEGFNKRFINS